MDYILKRFCPNLEFDSYEDFCRNFTINVPECFNFGYDVVDEWARVEPDKLALLWTDDAANMRSYTFADVSRISNQAANFFQSHGIKKGDVVMLILKQRPEVWFSMVGLCKLGAVCIPATYQLTPKDISYRCNAADVKMIVSVADEEIVGHIINALPACNQRPIVATLGPCSYAEHGFLNYSDELYRQDIQWQRPTGKDATTNDDCMLIYFSSGTTGMPKMVWHDFTFPLGHITTARFWQHVQENTVHMTQSDSGWAKFAWGKIYGQWICGAAIGAYDTEKFHSHDMLEAILRLHPTTFCAPATIYRFLIKEDLSGYDLSFIKHAGVAGEPLNPEVYHKIKELTGLALNEGFGQTETPVLLANYGFFPVRPGSMGKPNPCFDLDLVDENGESVEDGVVGSIVIRNAGTHGPVGMFRGYYRDEEVTRRSWHDGMYNTGDTAWRDADGYYWFVGRNDDVIKCSGYRIGPFEVESALLEHPSVLECAVTAAPDPVRGQVVKATIVLARGFEASEALKKELQNHVKRVTAPYKYPRIVEFVSELPKTISGKIQRNVIRKADERQS
ncbi:MAG TPA: AMP-binding protein [Candidatus Gallacutalibacter stercoravium]|nr:AMP-binding protein [Candidatus Gallacutalibacter stercoravium]